jgi:hypothetical protein
VRSISSRASVFFTERACAVAATVTSQRVSIGRPSSCSWIALIAATMRLPKRLARNWSRLASTCLLRLCHAYRFVCSRMAHLFVSLPTPAAFREVAFGAEG